VSSATRRQGRFLWLSTRMQDIQSHAGSAVLRKIGCLLAAAALTSCAGAETGSVATPGIDAGELSGRIAFMRGDPEQEAAVTYTVAPDGSDEREVFPEGNSASPTWSPDGTEIHVFCCDDGMVAHFVDPDTGELLRALPQPDPSLELFCGGSWSPDGDWISCEGFGVEDPTLNGIYTIRASDGGGMRRVTSSPDGFDAPGDFSPDGERLIFTRFVDDVPVGVFVIELDGSGLVQVSPADLTLDDTGFAGSWSPDGTQILFVGRASEEAHKEIWVVESDGGSPHRFEMTPACGGSFSDESSMGCYSPEWSPDGSMIVFTGSSWDGATENIYIVRTDGTGVLQVTGGNADDNPDWGTPTGEP
jgi:Tol biopolymer transport system component